MPIELYANYGLKGLTNMGNTCFAIYYIIEKLYNTIKKYYCLNIFLFTYLFLSV
jgi:hypothetical protein